MASLNLLFVHEVSYEKKPIFEMHEFPEHLAAKGHKVTFLQFDEGFKFWRDKRLPERKNIKGRVVPGVEMDIVTPYQFGIPGLDRIWATISVWPVLDRMLKNQKFDAIVLYAVPTYGHQVIQLAKKYGVPVVFRALDVSHLIRKSALSPLIKSAEKYVYKNADVLSANNPAMARYCSKLGGRRRNTYVNLPPLDVSHFAQSQVGYELIANLKQSIGIGADDKVVTYMGSFFYFSGLDVVIQEFVKVASKLSDVKLLLIGGGEQGDELRKLVKRLDLESKVLFTGFVPYEKLPSYLALSTIAINPMLPSQVSNTAFPHKVLQYMAAGLPVVSTKLAGIFETFGHASGVSWVSGPAATLSQAVDMVHKPDALSAAITSQSKIVERLLDVERAVSEFENVLTLNRLEI